MNSFRDLKVWQKAHNLVLDIYAITKKFPTEEKFRLTSQIIRAASSVPTNIVEGFKRKGAKEQSRFLNLSDSSLEETKYHIILAHDLGYLKKIDFERLNNSCDEIGRMLWGLNRKINEREEKDVNQTNT